MDRNHTRKLDEEALKCFDDFSKKVDTFREHMQSNELERDEEAFRNAEKTFWFSHRLYLQFAYALVGKYTMEHTFLEQEAMLDESAELLGIEAKAVDGKLFLRCPHVPRRISGSYFTGFRHELQHVIGSVSDQLELSPYKRIHIVHVYAPAKMNAAHAIDLDNYDYKNLIDEACRHYPDTDGPLATSISLSTICSEAIPAQTYLVITPDDYSGNIADEIEDVFCIAEGNRN